MLPLGPDNHFQIVTTATFNGPRTVVWHFLKIFELMLWVMISLNLFKEKKVVTESIFRGRDSVSPIERTGRVPIIGSAGHILAFQILIESNSSIFG